jgi:hypothetical protein
MVSVLAGTVTKQAEKCPNILRAKCSASGMADKSESLFGAINAIITYGQESGVGGANSQWVMRPRKAYRLTESLQRLLEHSRRATLNAYIMAAHGKSN